MSRGSSRDSLRRSSSTTSPPPRARVSRHVARLVTRLVAPLLVDYPASCRLELDYFASAARPGASARRATRHTARLCARRRLLCLAQARRAAHCSSLTTLPRAGSSSTTSPTPCVRVPRHVAWLVTRLVAPLVVDYSASRRLVSTTPPRAGSSRGTLLVVDNSASRGLVADYFASASHQGASARCAARRAARRRLLCLTQARRRLLRLRRASGCLGMSRGSSRGSSCRSSWTTPPHAGSSLTTSPSPRVRVSRHVARLVTPLVVDYFASAARPGASARRVARHAARRVACR
jgi:hypothetical protein